MTTVATLAEGDRAGKEQPTDTELVLLLAAWSRAAARGPAKRLALPINWAARLAELARRGLVRVTP